MKSIAIFYHCCFFLGDPPQPLASARRIVAEQMAQISGSGLLGAAAEFHVGVNGGAESEKLVGELFPFTARVSYHGLACHSENMTIVMLENWVKSHPDWLVLYLHSKGVTAEPGSEKDKRSTEWRRTMMQDLVLNWRMCVSLLAGHDIVCSHWKWNQADGTQHIPAGNFLWITSNFAARLPSIMERARVKMSGICAAESRYESEVYWGNGPRPNVKQFRPYGGNGIP